MTTLTEQIAARRAQAEERGIEEKSRIIAIGIGQRTHRALSTYSSYPYCVEGRYEKAPFLITFACVPDGRISGSYPWHTDVYIEGARVFHAVNGQIRGYVPGSWERSFDQLYQKALPAGLKVREEIERNIHLLREEKRDAEEALESKKWGL